MRRSILAVFIPILIILGSFIGFIFLHFLGVFANGASLYSSLSLLVLVYLSSLVVWTISPFQKDIVPMIVALSGFGSFLIGSVLLTNFVGLGLSPIPVLDIFFTQQGLNQTLPYFFKDFSSANSTNLDQPILLFLMVPIVTSILGIVLVCFIHLEKPSLLKVRLQHAAIRAICTIFVTFLLFFPLKSLLFNLSS